MKKLAARLLFCCLFWKSHLTGTDGTWNTQNGDWTNSANWLGGNVPGNGAGSIATFSAAGLSSGTPATININDPNITLTEFEINISLSQTDITFSFPRTNGGALTFISSSGIPYGLFSSGPTLQTTIGELGNNLPIILSSSNQLIISSGQTSSLQLFADISGAGSLQITSSAGTSTIGLSGTGTWTGNTFGAARITGSANVTSYDSTFFPVSSTAANGIFVTQDANLTLETGGSYFLTAEGNATILQQSGHDVFLSGLASPPSETPTVILESTTGSQFLLQIATANYGGAITGGIQSLGNFDPALGSRLTIGFNANQTFSGTNTYLCRTFVMADSTLTAASNGALGASTASGGSGVFVRSGGCLVNNNATLNKDFYLNGTGISNGGALQGSGTISGAVVLGWAGGVESAAAPSTNISSGNTLALTGVVSGSQPLTKIGPGTLQLFGANTFSGTPVVSAGVLEGNAASLPTNITNNATVLFTQNTTGTYAQVISGSGQVIKGGSDTLVVSGANTYSGGTTISSGTLEGTTTSIQGAIMNNSALLFRQASSGTFASAISGTGTVTVGASGGGSPAVTFSAAHSYSGNTVVGGAGFSPSVLRMGIADAISNSATLTVNDNGTFDLNNTNQSIRNLTGEGAIVLGSATLSVNPTAPSTFDGVISGSGGLSKLGANTLTLNNSNAYTGATAINGGALQAGIVDAIATSSGLSIGSGATFVMNDLSQHIGNLSGSGTISMGEGGADTLFINPTSATTTFSGVIEGAGALNKAGSNTLVLSGANTYTGATVIAPNGGTLRIGSANAIAASSGITVETGGTLDLNSFNQTIHDLAGGGTITLGSATLSVDPASTTATFTGAINGTGGVTKLGANMFVLSGVNGFTGATQIMAGTLRTGTTNALATSSNIAISSEGTLECNNMSQTVQGVTGSGHISLGSATLTVNPATATDTFSGSISGSGGVTKTGTNTLVLSGTNNYTGQTTVSAGTLSGNTDSIPSNSVVNNGTLIFAQNSPGTFSGAITGSGTLRKQGTESLVISAPVTQGSILVDSGLLRLNDTTLTSSGTMIGSGSVLRGNGTLASPTTVSGTVAPGNSIGTIMGTTFLFDSTSTLSLEVDASASSQVIASGAFTISPGATLQIIPIATLPPLSQYTIVLGNPVSGTFTNVLVSTPIYTPQVTYFSDHILLSLIFDRSGFDDYDLPGNPGDVLRALTGLDPNSSACVENLFNALNPLSLVQFERDLNQLHPALFNAFAISQENATISLRETITQRLEDLRYKCEDVYFYPGADFWMTPFGDFLGQDPLSHSPGFSTYTAGVTLGCDAQVKHGWTLGTNLSYSYSHVVIGKDADVSGRGQINSVYGSFYTTAWTRHFFLDLALTGAVNFFSGHRNVDLSTAIASVHKSPDHNNEGYEGAGHLAFGFPIGPSGLMGDAWCTPYAMADFIYLYETQYTEKEGDCLDLKVQKRHNTLLRAEEGLRLSACKIFSTVTLVPEVRLAVGQEWRFQGKYSNARFEVGDRYFKVHGLFPNRLLFLPGAGLSTYFFNNQAVLTARINAEVGQDYWDVRTQINFTFRF